MSAPPAPMKTNAASASGVADSFRLISVPIVTTWASSMTAVTVAIVASIANGTCPCGFDASPAGTGTTSKPPNAKISSRPAAEACGQVTA